MFGRTNRRTGMSLFLSLVCALIAACGDGGGSLSANPPPGTGPAPVPTPSISVSPVFPVLAFVSPIAMMQAPSDSSRWFVAQQGGRILQFVNDASTSNPSPFLDISAQVNDAFSESGLLGMAFHPNFPVTPFVYVNYTVAGSGIGNPLTSRISRFQSVDNGLTLFAGSEQIVLEVLQPFTNHNGGNLAFGPDSFLYASFGDGGSAGDPQDNAQNDNNLLGTIIQKFRGDSPMERMALA